MKIVKVLLVISAVIVVLLGASWQFIFKGQAAYARLATAYGAKQVCSCRYIGERSMKSCLGDFTLDVSALTFSEIPDEITAKAPYGLAQARAHYTPKLGCAVVK
jgi:hypothetical protein